SLALALSRIADLDLRGYDGSAPMVEVAQRKAAKEGAEITFGTADFLDPIPGPLADAVLLVYDGLNYLLHERQIATLFERVHAALRPGGVFIFDQSTPANSLNHVGEFDDEGRADAFAYTRSGEYDPETRIHTTTFELSASGEAHQETHLQRAYSLEEMQALLDASPLAPEAAYDAFSTDGADGASERIHWVARKTSA
ncbi:class I SAM-dependent methyltransferase, partial [Rubricoccus marinus]